MARKKKHKRQPKEQAPLEFNPIPLLERGHEIFERFADLVRDHFLETIRLRRSGDNKHTDHLADAVRADLERVFSGSYDELAQRVLAITRASARFWEIESEKELESLCTEEGDEQDPSAFERAEEMSRVLQEMRAVCQEILRGIDAIDDDEQRRVQFAIRKYYRKKGDDGGEKTRDQINQVVDLLTVQKKNTKPRKTLSITPAHRALNKRLSQFKARRADSLSPRIYLETIEAFATNVTELTPLDPLLIVQLLDIIEPGLKRKDIRKYLAAPARSRQFTASLSKFFKDIQTIFHHMDTAYTEHTLISIMTIQRVCADLRENEALSTLSIGLLKKISTKKNLEVGSLAKIGLAARRLQITIPHEASEFILWLYQDLKEYESFNSAENWHAVALPYVLLSFNIYDRVLLQKLYAQVKNVDNIHDAVQLVLAQELALCEGIDLLALLPDENLYPQAIELLKSRHQYACSHQNGSGVSLTEVSIFPIIRRSLETSQRSILSNHLSEQTGYLECDIWITEGEKSVDIELDGTNHLKINDSERNKIARRRGYLVVHLIVGIGQPDPLEKEKLGISNQFLSGEIELDAAYAQLAALEQQTADQLEGFSKSDSKTSDHATDSL